MRVTLKAVNDELAKRGSTARLVEASGYFFFLGGEADEWLDKNVSVSSISSFSLPEWIAECERPEEAERRVHGRQGR